MNQDIYRSLMRTKKSNKKKRCAIYGRVSTDKQFKNGVSIDSQIEMGKYYCNVNNFELYRIYVDGGVSGKKEKVEKRYSYQDLLNDIKSKKVDVIIATDLDRITRSVINTYELIDIAKKYDCELMLDGVICNLYDADDKFRLGLNALLAEREIDKTSERTKGKMMYAAQMGQTFGRKKLGYDKIKKQLVINEEEAKIVKLIYEMYLNGYTQSQIRAHLNNKNILNIKWSEEKIAGILCNPTYKGEYHYRHTIKDEETVVIKDIHPVIIEPEIWEAVQKQRKLNAVRCKKKEVYIFMQRLTCPYCNELMGGAGLGKKNPNLLYYRCNNKKCTFNKYAREDKIESQVVFFFNELLDYFSLVDKVSIPIHQDDVTFKIQEYNDELNKLDKNEAKIKRLLLKCTEIEEDDYINEIKYISTRRGEINAELLKLENSNQQLEAMDCETYLTKKKIEDRKIANEQFYHTNIWNQLTKEDRFSTITKYVDTIELELDDNNEIAVKKINLKQEMVTEILYLFRSKLLSLYMNSNSGNVIVSNLKSKESAQEYINKLKEYYNIKVVETNRNVVVDTLKGSNDLLEIIPLELNNRWDEQKYIMLFA